MKVKSIAEICNLEVDKIHNDSGIMEATNDAIRDICNNIHDYEFDCEKCSKPHKSLHRGKILQRLLRDAPTHDEQLLMLATLDHIMDLIYERVDGTNNALEKILLQALANSKKHQA